MGKPVFLTPLGAEGLDVRSGRDIEIAGDRRGVADRTIALLSNADRRAHLGDGGAGDGAGTVRLVLHRRSPGSAVQLGARRGRMTDSAPVRLLCFGFGDIQGSRGARVY